MLMLINHQVLSQFNLNDLMIWSFLWNKGSFKNAIEILYINIYKAAIAIVPVLKMFSTLFFY